jgi:hypothetical protein
MIATRSLQESARLFLLSGIQDHHQSEADRRSAIDQYLKMAGFDDPLAKPAQDWLLGVLTNLPWGNTDNEIAHLVAALEARIAGGKP